MELKTEIIKLCLNNIVIMTVEYCYAPPLFLISIISHSTTQQQQQQQEQERTLFVLSFVLFTLWLCVTIYHTLTSNTSHSHRHQSCYSCCLFERKTQTKVLSTHTFTEYILYIYIIYIVYCYVYYPHLWLSFYHDTSRHISEEFDPTTEQ